MWCEDDSMDSLFVRCYGIVDYKRWLAPVVAGHRATRDESYPTSLPVDVGFSISMINCASLLLGCI